MTYSSLLLRLLLIVALSLNGYAAAAMSAGGGHTMHAATAKAPSLADETMSADCHEGATMAQHDRAGDPSGQPEPAAHDDDCCGKFRCQCDCLQAVAIVRFTLPAPPQLANAPLALPMPTQTPNGVSSLPIRPPIA